MGNLHREPEYTLSAKGKQDGPFTEAELILMAREGGIRAGDLVRAEGEKRWMRASRVPWLRDHDGEPLKESGTPVWIQVVALVLVLAGLLGVLAIQRDAERADEVIDLGVVPAPAPDPSQTIRTEAWGVVPPGRINVRFHSGTSRAEADRVAAAVGGVVAGELPLLDLYVVDFPSRSERGLETALALAGAQRGVRIAFPEQIAFLTGSGRACSLADDPVYADGRSRSLEMIGLQTAWNLLRASGARLHPVQVGIVDSGIYLAHGEFDEGVRVLALGVADRLTDPQTGAGRAPLPYYSHATGVASVLAADAGDGGVVGVASILEGSLTLRVKNAFQDRFEAGSTAGGERLGAYAIATLASIQRLIEDGARVINLSWNLGADAAGGLRPAHVGIYRAYRDFFRKMGSRHPDVVFVCSAGNQGGTPGDEAFLPGGLDLPNVITVGNLDGEGRIGDTGTNRMAPGRAFHVDLAAPGQGVVYGVGPDGSVAAGDGGTSMAVPLVTATVAILKAVEPGLTCADIKEILQSTARAELEWTDGTLHAVPAEVGRGCLAVDRAVLKVLERRRAALGEAGALDPESLLDLTRIELAAVRQDDAERERWVVTASVPRTVHSTTTLAIRAPEGASVDGASSVTVTAGQEATWVVMPGEGGSVEVVRADTEACWRVELAD